MADYYKQAIGTLPTRDFLKNILYLVFADYPHLQPIQEYLYSVIKHFLAGLKHHDWMWEVLYLFDREAAARVSGAAETVDYFG